jgi:cellulose synthase (UDP-forming)
LTAPLAYLFFGAHVFQATAAMITAYALPHLAHASITNSRIQGRFRYSFWNEVYESVLAWYIMRPVLLAVINPKLGKFNVTAKGGVVERSYFDWSIARPYLILLIVNLLGFAVGIWRLMVAPDAVIFTTVIINMVWTIYNIILTSASLAVASETRQIRSTPRVTVALPAALRFADGRTLMCETDDFSQNGVGLRLQSPVPVEIGTRVDVALFRSEEESAFPATVTFSGNGRLGLQFEDLTLHQQAALSRLTFGRADVWLGFWGNRQHDQPLTSFKSVVVIGVRGLSQVAANLLNILRGRRVALGERPSGS